MAEINNEQDSAFQSLSELKRRWKEGTFKEIWDDWKWIFTYSVRYKGVILYYLILGMISTSLGLVSSVAGKYIIDIVTGYQTDKLWVLIVLAVGSSLFSLTIGNYLGRLNLKLGINIGNDIQADIFGKIIDADWKSISKFSNGDVLNRFTNDIGTVGSNAIGWLPSVVLTVYQFIATFCVIWYYNPVMALFAFASAPFTLIASKIVIKKQREYGKKVRAMSSDVMAFQMETFYNFDTIKSFGVADQYTKKLKWWQRRFKDMQLDYNWFSIKTNIYFSIVGMLVGFSAFGYCLWLLWTHQITYGTMTLFLQQRAQLEGAFSGLISIIPGFLNSSISAHRVRELVQLPKEVHLPQSSDLNRYIDEGFTVKMDDVDFSYVEDKKVITNSDFQAHPGEIVALVGPSGEGKTTLIRLILGLTHPDRGKASLVTRDGTEVEMNADTRHLFSYVPQGNTIISGTVAENMRLAKENATDEEIIEALKIACAWDFIEKLPDTINTQIGERGRGFSEGQVQRIAIARAVLRDAPIMLMDEATSALDITTERKVLKSIVQQRPNKTCIVTTHRPTVLNLSQRVYRVMQTKVTELSEEESSRMAMDF
ncbi:MAG: ABC transporter ATP-binding protein/permease [Bacteroidaceae bacterium]|nr:ABC transporter ATP-binding protein/permease [Bacteroidaceae bacterium]